MSIPREEKKLTISAIIPTRIFGFWVLARPCLPTSRTARGMTKSPRKRNGDGEDILSVERFVEPPAIPVITVGEKFSISLLHGVVDRKSHTVP